MFEWTVLLLVGLVLIGGVIIYNRLARMLHEGTGK